MSSCHPVPNMKKVFLALCIVLVLIAACNTQKEAASPKAEPSVQKSPLFLSVVPETSHGEPFGSTIEMAHGKPRDFFVVLTNVSAERQAVWEYWNSWGYQTVSFELTTEDGKKFVVSRRQEEFTRNFPSTFLIERGEQSGLCDPTRRTVGNASCASQGRRDVHHPESDLRSSFHAGGRTV